MARHSSVCLVAASVARLGNAAAAQSYAESGIRVAEVKPHYGCTHQEGQDRVRAHIAGLANETYGLISLLQTDFAIPQLDGYMAFGAACTTKHADPAVVLVDEAQFSLMSVIGETVAGDFAAMPFLGDGQEPASGSGGTMCMANPDDTYPDHAGTIGSRPYAGAVLQHKASGKEVCVVTGTFPHCMAQWQKSFTEAVAEGCGDRQLIVIADTNAGCVPTQIDSQGYTMQRIAEEQGVDWGSCSDPGVEGPPTCCDDIKQGVLYPRYWYDRTAICRGGRVEQFEVLPGWVCQNSDAEHKFTTAVIFLDDEPAVV